MGFFKKLKKAVKKAGKVVEKAAKPVTTPLQKVGKAIEGAAKPITKPIQSAASAVAKPVLSAAELAKKGIVQPIKSGVTKAVAPLQKLPGGTAFAIPLTGGFAGIGAAAGAAAGAGIGASVPIQTLGVATKGVKESITDLKEGAFAQAAHATKLAGTALAPATLGLSQVGASKVVPILQTKAAGKDPSKLDIGALNLGSFFTTTVPAFGGLAPGSSDPSSGQVTQGSSNWFDDATDTLHELASGAKSLGEIYGTFKGIFDPDEPEAAKTPPFVPGSGSGGTVALGPQGQNMLPWILGFGALGLVVVVASRR